MRLVLLRDSRWPDVPGVCCWRTAAHAAFGAAGATVADVTWHGPAYVPPAPKSGTPATRPQVARRRWEWLPAPVRAGMTDVQKVSRKIRRRVASRRPPAAPPVAGLDGADVIVAESLPAALATVDGGAPGDRLWALALPPMMTLPGGATPFTDLVDALTPRIAGFITDSELGRDAVERAAASGRPRVVVLPPIVPDRPCPDCADVPGREHELDPDTAAAVDQLAAWRHPSDIFSFPMARRRGLSADWAPTAWLDWAQDGRDQPRPSLPDTPSDWTAAAQDAGARAVVAATLPVEATPARPHRSVLISGFDLKFIRELGARLDDRTDFTVALDEWKWVSAHTDQTKALLAKADSVVAEWARPSAGWLAERKRPEQNLIVRLHRFELDSAYPKQIDIDNVDAVVYIAPALGPRIHDEIGWPKEKLVYIPNFLDIDWLDRPKLPDARFAIGMVGTERFLKRFDLALDVLAAVRREDPRFTLHVRSMAPWDNPNVWAKPDEQEYAGWCRERVERDPLLHGGVVFDPPGRDMARWYRRVGAFLSMSDIEGVHLAAAEAMASGAVPVFRPWPGVRDVYDERWIHPSVDDAAAALLANADPDGWAERSAAARAEMWRRYDPTAVVTAWADLLHGELDRAREPFASYVRI